MRRVLTRAALAGVLTAGLAGCHGEPEHVPLIDRKIAITDKFYDVAALSAERAIVVGYGGKILETRDGGRSWTLLPSGTDLALYNVEFVDPDYGWIVGQDGLVLRTQDGGKTWERQTSTTEHYLFALSAVDRQRAFAVGDRATFAWTGDGGVTWHARTVPMTADVAGGESLAAQDPVFYAVRFLDAQTGWLSGEFGKIMHTTDGGETWTEQQQALMGDEFFDALDLPTMFGLSFVNAQEGVATGLDGRIARTRDGGATWGWEEVTSTFALVDPFFQPTIFPDGGGWAVGAAGPGVRRDPGDGIWRTADLGMPLLTWLRGIAFSDRQNGWIVGGYGLILRTTDGGTMWLPCLG
jgi:photosystem II stability/assembly factor-like uncharacterized protein